MEQMRFIDSFAFNERSSVFFFLTTSTEVIIIIIIITEIFRVV